MQKNRPLVSVILPIYNAEGSLDQALSSVENQTLQNIEILAINDGSTDASLEIMLDHAQKDPRIRVIDKPNQGYGASCNRGIDEARGTWISIVEPDDWVKPNMYKDMLDYVAGFNEQPIDIVKTPYIRISYPNTERQKSLQCSYYHRIHPTHQPFTISDPGVVDILAHHPSIWSAIYRKQFLDDHAIRFRPIPGAGWADNPFLIDSMCQAKRIVYFDIPYYCYRENTPAEDITFTMNNPTLPFDRWQDMQDELDRLGIHDEGIQRSHNSRGFTYLSGVIEVIPLSDPAVHTAAVRMVNRMDAQLVLSDRKTSPAMKKLFCQLRHIPEPHPDYIQYAFSLAQEAQYHLFNNGPVPTFGMVKTYLEKFATRNGKKAPSIERLEHYEKISAQKKQIASNRKKRAQQAEGNVEVVSDYGTTITDAKDFMADITDSRAH